MGDPVSNVLSGHFPQPDTSASVIRETRQSLSKKLWERVTRKLNKNHYLKILVSHGKRSQEYRFVPSAALTDPTDRVRPNIPSGAHCKPVAGQFESPRHLAIDMQRSTAKNSPRDSQGLRHFDSLMEPCRGELLARLAVLARYHPQEGRRRQSQDSSPRHECRSSAGRSLALRS